jgi:hypothetical protein
MTDLVQPKENPPSTSGSDGERYNQRWRKELYGVRAERLLIDALVALRECDSGEHTASDRYVAIAITDIEKLITFVSVHVAK